MKWSWKIGRPFGIDTEVHASFLLLLLWVVFGAFSDGGTLAAAAYSVAFLVGVFASVVLHELGHALTARRFGIKTRDITLLPIGGVARMERMPERPREEILVALAGPAVNVALAGAGVAWIVATMGAGALGDPVMLSETIAGQFFLANVALAVFNMVPAFPMDGGRVLRASLALRMDRVRATRVAATLGQGLALLFGLVGMFANPMLLFIALFVWMGAAGEAELTEMNAMLSGVSVRQGMITEFHTLRAEDPVAVAVEHIVRGFQTDFPVLSDGRLIGILTREKAVEALSQTGPGTPAGSAVETDFKAARPQDPLRDALERLQEGKCRSMPVLAGERVVGLVTLENVAEVFMIRSALARTPAAPLRTARGHVT